MERKAKPTRMTIKSEEHTEQMAFQESEYFKEKAKERYKIEAKNSELKHRHGHGYDVATSSGLLGMEIQRAIAIFTVNLKRILKRTHRKFYFTEYRFCEVNIKINCRSSHRKNIHRRRQSML